jgi:hypothetical protein
MQLNIKKYESANIYVLLRDNIIIGIYTSFEDATTAKHLVQYKHKESNSWIIL